MLELCYEPGYDRLGSSNKKYDLSSRICASVNRGVG